MVQHCCPAQCNLALCCWTSMMYKVPVTAISPLISLAMCRYVKFDTFHPAVEKGLPVTRVVSRVALQAILAEACMRVAGSDVICNDCHVIDYEEKVRFAPALTDRSHNDPKLCPLERASGVDPYSGVVLQLDEFGQKKVYAVLEDGKSIAGDVLIGADGIWSKVGEP